MKLTPSKNAEAIAVQYLQHEFRKILLGIKDKKTLRRIDRELEKFPKVHGEASFWNLVAAISDDWKLKGVYQILSHDGIVWKRKRVSFDDIIFTGMSPELDVYIVKKCGRSPKKFLELWRKDARMRKEILKTGLAPHKERDHFPVFLVRIPEGYRVFDGMRRSLLKLVSGKKNIECWVGELKQNKGKPLISGGFGYVLSRTYENSSRKSKKIDSALTEFTKVIASDYRNGKDLMKNRIAGWSHNPAVKKSINKAFK